MLYLDGMIAKKVAALALVFALGTLAPSAVEAQEAEAFVARVAGTEESHPTALEQAVADVLAGEGTSPAAGRQLEALLRLPAGAGEPLLRGVVGASSVRTREELTESEFRGVEADLLSAFDRLRNGALAEDLAQLYAAAPDWAPSSRLFETIERSPRPLALGLGLVEQGCCGKERRGVLAAALRAPADPAAGPGEGPSRAQLLERLAAELTDRPAWRLALLEAAMSESSDAPFEAGRQVASSWLSALMELGLGRQAVAAFDALPVALQEQLLAAAPRGRFALDLAASRWLAGDRRGAAGLLEGTPAGARAALLRELIDPQLADPFPLFAALEAGGPGSSGVWDQIVAALAERSRYPEVVADRSRRLGRTLGGTSESLPAEWEATVPLAWLTSARNWNRELSTLAEQLEQTGGTSAAGETAVTARLAVLLREPALRPWREQPLPRGIAPAHEEAVPQALPAGLVLPPGRQASRIARRGLEVAALVTAQDLDPKGGLWEEGSYWVLRSHDGGRTWPSLLPTGLQVGLPYVVAENSRLPLAAGGGNDLQAEVDLYSSDEERVELRQRGLALQLSLADLERDSDRDGLTDLAEDSLFTDPASPDSDGDGLNDAADPLPLVAFSPEPSARNRALSAALDWLAESDPRPRSALRTRYLIADRAQFRGLARPADRLVVLSEAEAAAAARKRGSLRFQRLSLLVLDHSGRHGLVVWSEPAAGGVLRLELVGGKWQVEPAAEWVS